MRVKGALKHCLTIVKKTLLICTRGTCKHPSQILLCMQQGINTFVLKTMKNCLLSFP